MFIKLISNNFCDMACIQICFKAGSGSLISMRFFGLNAAFKGVSPNIQPWPISPRLQKAQPCAENPSTKSKFYCLLVSNFFFYGWVCSSLFCPNIFYTELQVCSYRCVEKVCEQLDFFPLSFIAPFEDEVTLLLLVDFSNQ
jgi:hypothetical protein